MTAAATIPERRAAATASLAELERAHGIAALDGADFDAGQLAAVRAELEALDAAELEAHRRESAAAAAAQASARRQAAKEARKAVGAYRDAVGRCEASAKALVGELRAMDASAAELRRCFLVMSRSLPTTLDARSIRTTISRLLAGELTGIDRLCGFGDLKWPSVPVRADWSEHIDKWMQPAVEAAIEKEAQ